MPLDLPDIENTPTLLNFRGFRANVKEFSIDQQNWLNLTVTTTVFLTVTR